MKRRRRPETKKHRQLGAEIMRKRDVYRVKQDELARALGLSSRTVLRWENGYARPTVEQLTKLVRYFAGLEEADGEDIARAYGSSLEVLGIPRASAAAAAAVVPAVTIEAHRGAAELALYVAADELEMRAGKLRGAIVKMLGTLGGIGLTCEEARGLMEKAEG